eukprot:gene1946-2215_t
MDKEIDDILDNDVKLEAVNQSPWPAGKVINIGSKHTLIHQLIVHEVIYQRLPQVLSIRDGLKALDVLNMIIKHPDLCCTLFIPAERVLDADSFLAKIAPSAQTEQVDPVKKQAKQWFFKYVKEKGSEESADFVKGRLVELLKFCTGHAATSPLNPFEINLKYLEDDEAKVLPEAIACLDTLCLPTVHTIYNSFVRYMNTALEFASSGFGNY